MTKEVKLYGMFVLAILIMGAWAVFFHYYPVEVLVSRVGIENTYFMAFMLALIGGFSSVTGASLYAALIALAKGGVDPSVLGLISGLGLFISDSLFFFILSQMRHLLFRVTVTWERVCRKAWRILYRTPRWVVYLVIFLWSAFAPLPNDVLLAVLALSGYSYRKFAIFLLLGDITFTLLLTHIAARL